MEKKKKMMAMWMTTMIRAMTKMMRMKMNKKIIIENAYFSNIFRIKHTD
jgi:hypothetical protein